MCRISSSRWARGIAIALLMAAGAAQASAQTVAADRVRLKPGPCVFSTGGGAPAGGNVCDMYLDAATGNLYTKTGSGWQKVNTYGTVTSVNGSGPSGFLTWGSAVTTSGNITATLANQSANQVLAGPSSGGATTPAFRALVLADLPTTTAGSVLISGMAASWSNHPPLTGITSPAATNLTLDPTGDVVLGPTGADVLPNAAYTINLGALSNKYLALHAAELWVETLVQQNTIATIGGRVLVAPTNTLILDMAPADANIYVKYNNFASGDRIYLEADGKVEWMAISSGANATTGGYYYNVTRNLDGSGANQWYAGDAALDTGQAGNGFIDLYSLTGVLSGAGPTIVGNVRTGTTYSDIAARWAIGNLNGLYGYGATTYGVAMGDPSATNVTIDATNGFRIRNGTTNKLTADTSGNLSLVGDLSIGTSGVLRSGATAYGTGTGYWFDYNGGTPQSRVGDPAGNRWAWDGTNLAVVSSTVSIDSGGILVTPNSSNAYNSLNGYKFDNSGLFGVYAMDTTGVSATRAVKISSNWHGTGNKSAVIDLLVKNDPVSGGTTNSGFIELVANGTNATFGAFGFASTAFDGTFAWGGGSAITSSSAVALLAGNTFTGANTFSQAADNIQTITCTTTTCGTNLLLKAGNGTTSSEYVYQRFLANETSPQEWRVGLYGSKDFIWYDYTGTATRMTLTAGGSLGIGKAPGYQLELSTDSAGKPTSSTWTIVSDAKTKKNIAAYTGLDKLRRVQIDEYDYTGEYGQPAVHGVGPLAQEIQSVFPRSVSTLMLQRVPDVRDRDGKIVTAGTAPEPILAFNPHELFMATVQGVIELDRQVQQLRADVDALKKKAGIQ